MLTLTQSVLALALLTGSFAAQPEHAPVPSAAGAPGANSASWLLTFKGKSTNDLVHDRRFPAFLRTHVSTHTLAYWSKTRSVPASDALQFLGGPPDDVQVLENRYLIASACVPHDCGERGLLWVDTASGATVFAPSVWDTTTPALGDSSRYHLYLFSNTALTPSSLPPTLIHAIATWSAVPNGDGTSHSQIGSVTLMQPDGTRTALTPADVHAWTPNA